MKRIKTAALIAVVLTLALTFAACFAAPRDSSQGKPSVPGGTPDEPDGDAAENCFYLTVRGEKAQVTLADNAAVAALIEILKQGDLTYTAEEYGGFEKVGNIAHRLPTDPARMRAEPGDVMLYGNDNIVLFYGSNTWSYTRLGKIEGYSASALRSWLGSGSAQITVSLE